MVRSAEPEDLEPVLGLTRDFVNSFPVNEEAFQKSFFTLIDLPDVHFLIAEENGVVVGYLLGSVHVTLYANGPVGWVDEIMVDERYRRHGVGAQLLTAFEAWARSRGAVLSTLATRRAAPFYLALGYEESASYFKKML